MATKEPPKSGLFAKVARFVANPTTNWQELDAPTTINQSHDPRQADRDAMKALLELKRRNDFVRQREFNMLRKIRQKEAGLKDSTKTGGKPSFFNSSLPSKDGEKANTLKKINEIEAQMSMQWWTTKHANSSILNSSTFGTSLPQTMAPQMGKPVAAAAPPPSNENLLEFNFDEAIKPSTTKASTPVAPNLATPAQPISSQIKATPVIRAPTPAPVKPRADAVTEPLELMPATAPIPAATDYSPSKMFAIEVDEIVHNPNMEEAAIRFANGDDDGAEQALKEALVADQNGLQNEDAWLALFDLYRASGNQFKFEAAALDYANYFQRSAPQWISFPDLLKNLKKPPAPSSDAQSTVHWKCPPSLSIQSLAAMKAVLEKSPQPWRLDWSKLTKIEESALEPFYKVVHSWCESTRTEMLFEGTSNLEGILVTCTPTNNKEIDHRWWHLRLECLRLLHRPDEFEMVALDYCVTYEVSPPSWTVASCKCRSAGSAVQNATELSVLSSNLSNLGSNFGSTSSGPNSGISGLNSKLVSIEITGHIEGDPQNIIERLSKSAENFDIVVVSCEKLIRIDFSAAGSLLNWVIGQEQQGRQIQFVQVHRLILAFFHVIGISDHAMTSVRMH
jgi:ABC-type transporter Mla MlaB component